MQLDLSTSLVMVTVAVNGLLVGASLDQSIKQLPARRRIGALAFSAYSQAADLRNGVRWYAVLGLGSALLTFVTAITALLSQSHASYTTALVVAVGLTVAHTATTAVAAPLNFSQRKASGDKRALTRIFDRFERLQIIRAVLQTATLSALVWALTVAIAPITLLLVLLTATFTVASIGAGATLDQTIKQLPARHQLGALAYSAYSQAADGANGRFWYIPLGIIWLVLILTSAVVGWVSRPIPPQLVALGLMVAGLVAHGLITGLAAPLLLSQNKYTGDEAGLTRLFDRFAHLNRIRAFIEVEVLIATAWVLVATIKVQ